MESQIIKQNEAYLDVVALEAMKVMLMRKQPDSAQACEDLAREAHRMALAMLHRKKRMPEMLKGLPYLRKEGKKEESK